MGVGEGEGEGEGGGEGGGGIRLPNLIKWETRI